MNGAIFLRMRLRWGWVLRALLVACALLTVRRNAYAFCFAPQLRVSDEYFISPLVLTGTVTASRNVVDPEDPEGWTGTFYTIRVEKVYRGTEPKSLVVYSENSTSRFPMELNRPYILFLTKDTEANWMVDNCGNSGQVSLDSAVMAQLKQLPLRQSFVYGEVYSWQSPEHCIPMQLTVHSAKKTATTTVEPNCSFKVDVPPGRYQAVLRRNGTPVAANDPNYKDVYCFVVPIGGSAGIAFRIADGADALNREMVLKDDRHAKSLCAKSRAPEYLF
jgi:hypothetical protein